MAGGNSGRNTRISLACIACRSRKHKCSGEKPQCAQCASSNISCEWPAQQKRGPPKQYIHSLEARLFETETILLALLEDVSAEQLQASFQRIKSPVHTHSTSQYQIGHSSQFSTVVRHDVCRPSYWNSFPLDSPENVRRWWEDRASEINIPSFTTSIGGDLETSELPDTNPRTNAMSIEVANSGNLGPSQFAESVEQISEAGLMNTELQESVSEPEFGSECPFKPSTQYGHSENIPFQSRRIVNDGDNSIHSLDEEGEEGVLKLPSQFKLDFVW